MAQFTLILIQPVLSKLTRRTKKSFSHWPNKIPESGPEPVALLCVERKLCFYPELFINQKKFWSSAKRPETTLTLNDLDPERPWPWTTLTLNDPDPEQPWPWTTLTLNNPDPEQPWPWTTLTLNNLDLEQPWPWTTLSFEWRRLTLTPENFQPR